MNAFTQASLVEHRGLAVLLPYLEERAYRGRVVSTARGPLSRTLQKAYGDFFMNTDPETVHSLEIKVERHWTGNLFLETWSNLNLADRDAHAEPGRDADLLAACQRYAAARQAIRDADDLPDEDPRWYAYDAARDAISDARPQRMQGILAKARACMLDSVDREGFDASAGAMCVEWAQDVVRDLLRLAGDKLPPRQRPAAQVC